MADLQRVTPKKCKFAKRQWTPKSKTEQCEICKTDFQKVSGNGAKPMCSKHLLGS